jgi:hypothetical protein
MVVQRIADLRLPYFKHFDRIPTAAPVPAAILASYVGNYESAPGRTEEEITVSGDHLTIAFPKKKEIAIPTSETEFLISILTILLNTTK